MFIKLLVIFIIISIIMFISVLITSHLNDEEVNMNELDCEMANKLKEFRMKSEHKDSIIESNGGN